ncbi:MAG: cell division protein ZapA [Gemmatimonadetes bacterium]|nr:cell division protein ZapA [Gemmatimonadota bacterium]MCY3611620.1 cell division protein ZapA [Gemmatimonadota bacterium]MCY3678275.1 cell division protein ZapA [Gemmatimonadota bacterium]MYA42724.1 cell division protein ZapA [Gemmatimonadota bacterium]MYE95298.1 cell division protein ZapA [Gemmatimonadota bacterium]
MSESSGGSRKAIQVRIAGETYTLRTDADEEYARRCAALVDERMREIGGETGLDAKKTAILAALALSDELFRQEARTRARATVLAGRIENALTE